MILRLLGRLWLLAVFLLLLGLGSITNLHADGIRILPEGDAWKIREFTLLDERRLL